MIMISDLLIRHLRQRCLHLASLGSPILLISYSNSLQKSSAIQNISVILFLVIIAIQVVSY